MTNFATFEEELDFENKKLSQTPLKSFKTFEEELAFENSKLGVEEKSQPKADEGVLGGLKTAWEEGIKPAIVEAPEKFPEFVSEKLFDFAEAQKIGLEAITKGEPEEEWKKKNILEKAGIRPEAEMLTKMFKGELPEQVQAFENPTFNSAFNMVYDIGKTGLDLVSGISGFVAGAGASLFALTAPEGAAREKALKDAKGIGQIVGSLFGLQEKLPPSAMSEVINTTAALPFNMVLSMMHAGIETLPLSETNKTKAHIFGDVAAVIGGVELVNKTALKSINKILSNVEGTSTANKFRVAAARKMIDEQLAKQRDMEIILSPAENIANVGRVVDVVGDAIETMPKEQQLDLFNNVKETYSQDNLVKQFTPEQLALFERPPEQLELPLAVSEKGEKLTVKDLVNAEGKLSIPKGATFTRQYELPMEFPVKGVDLEGVKRIKAVEEQERVRAELEKPAPEIKKPKLTEKESYAEWLSKEMEIEDKVSKAGQEEFKLIPEEQPSIMEGLARIVGEIKGYSAEQIKDSITKAKDPNGIIADAFNGELSAAVNMRRRGNDIEAQRMIERITETANRIKQEFPEFDKIVDAKLEVIKGADVALGQLGLPLYEKVGKEKIAAPEESGQPKEAKPTPLPEGKGKEPIKVKPIDIRESFLEDKGYSPQKIKAIINEIGKKPELVSKWLEKNVSSEKRAEIIAKLEGKETPEIKGQRVTFEEGTERGRKGLDNITDEDYEAASKRFVGNLGKVVSAIREAKLSGTLDSLGLQSAYEALAKVHKNLKDVPFEQMKQDLQKIATYLIRKGKEKVDDFVKRMTDKWGSYIEPLARDAWKQAEELEGFKKGEEVTEKFTPVEKVDLKKELLIAESELKRYENSVFVTPEGLKEKIDRYEKALTAFEKSETSQMAPATKFTEGRLKNHSELIPELEKVKTADDLVFVTKRAVTKDPIADSMIEMIQSSEEMKKLLKATPVKVTTNIPLSEEARSEYVPKQKGAQININLYKGHQLDDIVFGSIHELGHAALTRKLAVDAKARASLQELLDYIINEKLTLGERHAIKLVTERMKQKKDTGFTEAQEHKYYHLGDISEFGAGILSSREFQKFTTEIEWPGKQHGAPKSNVWKEAVSRIYDFFFPKWDKPKNITVFEEALKRIGTIMEQPEPKFVSQEMMKNLAPRKQLIEEFAKPKSEVMKDISKGVDKWVGIISTRLGNIAPELKDMIRKQAFAETLHLKEGLDKVKPFDEAFKKFDEKTQFKVTQLLNNGQFEEVHKFFGTKTTGKSFDAVTKALDELYLRAIGSGMSIEAIENYFPRKVRDYEGLMKAFGLEEKSMIQEALTAEAKKQGVKLNELTNETKGMIADKLLRGWSQNKIFLTDPKHAKVRTIGKLTDKLTQFYEPADVALTDYFVTMNRAIEVNEFFKKWSGKKFGPFGLEIFHADKVQESIGDIVVGLKLNAQQEYEVRNILQDYFMPKSQGKYISGIRAIAYNMVLGNPVTAFTQLQDLGVTRARFGVTNMLKAVGAKLTGLQQWKLEDIAIDHFMADFERKSKMGLTSRIIMKPMSIMDVFGKEVNMNASYYKMVQQLKSGDKELEGDINRIFGKEASQVKKDLMTGKKTFETAFYLFNELSKSHPISKAEVPQKFLATNKGRLLYMLHTYQLKQLDIYRNDVWNTAKKGDYAKATKNMVNLTFWLLAAGVAINAVRDFLLHGETQDLDKYLTDSAWQIVLVNRYLMDKGFREGVGSFFWSAVEPVVFRLTDDITKDLKDVVIGTESDKGLRTTRFIPFVGAPYYYSAGRGSETWEERMNKEEE